MGALVGVQILNYILPIITIPVIVRIIGPSKFGLINYASSIVAYFILFISFSFELSASRYIAMNQDNHEKINQIFSRVFFTKICLFFFSALIFILLLSGFETLQKDKLIAIYTFLICIGTVFDCNYFYAAKQDLKQTALFNLVTKVIMNLSLLYFIRKQDDYLYQPLIISLTQIFVGFFAFLWAIRRYKLRIAFPGLNSIWRIIWSDKTLFFHSFAHTVYTTFNIIMLGFFRGTIEVGYYTAGWKLIILIQALLISPLGMVLFPIIGQAFGKSNEEGLKIVQKFLPVILFSTFIIAIGILILGGPFILIFYGSKFHDSILIFKLLSFMPMMLALNMLFGIQTMVNLKMDKKFFAITLAASFFNILLNLLLINRIGSVGAAISWFLTETFCTVVMYIVLTKNHVTLFNYEYFNFSGLKSSMAPVIEKFKDRFKKPNL
ncbi:MAG TPA: oligosaccharide flippase family protein [Mucilaginibacter sp.]|nr:oligosaccharide flippase family protein [Mucilaginibacter sp.]